MNDLNSHKIFRRLLPTILYYSIGISACMVLNILFSGGAHFPGMGTCMLILMGFIGFLMAAKYVLLPGESKNQLILIHIIAILLIIFVIGI
jgi:hypothetical protein